jgi:hypothetical protein
LYDQKTFEKNVNTAKESERRLLLKGFVQAEGREWNIFTKNNFSHNIFVPACYHQTYNKIFISKKKRTAGLK